MSRAERLRYAAAVAEAAAADPVIVERVTAAGDRLALLVARNQPRFPVGKLADYEWGRVLLAEGDEAMRSAALWAHHEVCHETRFVHRNVHTEVCGILARRRLRWTADEVRWAFALLWAADPWRVGQQCAMVLAAAEHVPAEHRPELADHLERLRTFERAAAHSHDEARRQRRIRALLGIGDAAAATLPRSILHDGDPFGPAVRAELAGALAAPGAVTLLVHCATANGVLPSDRWASTAARLLAATSGGPALLRGLLERLLELPDRSTQEYWDDEPHTIWHWLHPDTVTLVRGVLWTVGALDEPWVERLLGDLALRCGTGPGGGRQPRAERLASTAVALIGERAGPDAVRTLTVLHQKLTQRSLRARITTALDRVAAGAGMPLEHLLERSVPDFDLDAAGRREHVLGAHVATLAVHGGVTLGFRTAAGRELKGVPAAVRTHHAAELAELRATVKALRTTLAAQRDRIEDLLVTERSWAHGDWARHYRDHPVVGAHARVLIWELDIGADGWVAGWPQDGGFVDAAGRPLPVPDATTRMRLWHPQAVPAEQTAAWRRFVTDRELRQPFKQAFREVYLLTPAERRTRVYSNRFAAHVIRAPQAGSLLTARGWRSPHLGDWDGGYDGHATKEFGEWRAEFHFDGVVTYGEDHLVSTAVSDQVRFSRAGGDDWILADLDQVPPRVFSEAMRDVDLVVGVASIAGDPAWIDRGEDRHLEYWHGASVGPLAESAQMRREALARLIPRTRIAERCTLEDRFLTVRGDLCTYKIHLGSTTILMEPNDTYLCIVPRRDRAAPYLPFEEDGGALSVIVSKAFLLAADATITDGTILEQIRRR